MHFVPSYYPPQTSSETVTLSLLSSFLFSFFFFYLFFYYNIAINTSHLSKGEHISKYNKKKEKRNLFRDESAGPLRLVLLPLAFRAALEHGGELGCSFDISKERRARWKSPLVHLASSRRVTFEYLARFSLNSRSRRS